MQNKPKAKPRNANRGTSAKKSSTPHANKPKQQGKSQGKQLHASKPKQPTKQPTVNNKPKQPQSDFLRKEEYYSGVMQRTQKGYGFLICDELDEDIFIPANSMNGANHNDIAEVRLTLKGRKGLEGEVIGIIERRLTKVVGTIRVLKGYCLVEPDDKRICKEVFVASAEAKNAINGEKVVVEITSFEHMRGKVVEVLGMPEDKSVDILSVIRAYNLYESFPSSVEREAKNVPSEVQENEIEGRVDFKDDLVITIDGDDSRDFDDAVSLKKDAEGLYELHVHIADVAHYVLHGSKLDLEAYKRGTSVYFPELVLPMLPRHLSNGICSLNENVARLTLSVIMHIDEYGKVKSHKVCEGVIKSSYRMTYNKVAKILDGDEMLTNQYKSLVPMLNDMQDLSKILTKKRERRGAIDFDLPECQVILDENGKTKAIEKKPRLISHKIIEEFMLIANETIAHFMHDQKAPFVYRVHESPPLEKLERLSDFLGAVGQKTNFLEEAPTPKQLQTLLKSIPNELSYAVNRATLRSMAKASYECENKGHYGLAAQDYCHFTSPIRRYPDLVIHRIIKDYLKHGKKAMKKYETFVKEAASLSSVRERLAEKAERDVDDLKKAEFMSNKIGECFDGVISSVTDFGFFVELDNSIEGLVRIESLDGNGYEFNPRSLTIKNQALTYKLGQKVKVRVESVASSKISFSLQK